MKSGPPEEGEFVLLGSYTPRETSKLLERLEQAGIAFRAEPLQPDDADSGPTVTINISVDSSRSNEVDQIHREVFGAELPNYDSSFFRSQRNV